MVERTHWRIARWLRLWLTHSLSFSSVRLFATPIIFLNLSIYLSVYLSFFLSICLAVYLTVYLCIYPSIYLLGLSFYLSIHLSIHPSIYLSNLSVYRSICLSVCLSIYLSIFLSFPFLSYPILLSICLSICLSIYLSYPIQSYPILSYPSSTAQGSGGSFKNRKPIGEVGCCESRMAERIHWWTDRWLELCFWNGCNGCSGHVTTTAGCSVVWRSCSCSCSCSCSVVECSGAVAVMQCN